MAIKKIPCGGFSYDDTEISFENGVIHPIGGGGKEIENAKETGGFGWTETNPDALHITWDGDVTGKETVTPSPDGVLCLVSDKTPESMIGCKVQTSIDYSFYITDEDIYTFDGGYAVGDAAVMCVFNDNTTIVSETGTTFTFEHKGVYFLKTEELFVKEVSDQSEIIHKIDPKYLGGGGGLDLFVVNVTNVEEIEGTTVLSFDKTYDEIMQAIIDLTMPVVCVFEGTIFTLDYTNDNSIVFKYTNVVLDNDGTMRVSNDVITIYKEADKGIETFVGEFSYSADE